MASNRAPARHAGKSRTYEDGVPDRLGPTLWHRPGEPILVVLGSLIGLGWGLDTLSDSHAASLVRVLAATAATGSILAVVSYALRFAKPLTGPRWTASRPRRAARLVLRFAWLTPVIITVVVGLLERVRGVS